MPRLLLESGFDLLLESGDGLLLESDLDPDLLAWAHAFPVKLYPRRAMAPTARWHGAAPILPIPRPLPPTELIWLPNQTALTTRRKLRGLTGLGSPVIHPLLLSPLMWTPIYLGVQRRKRLGAIRYAGEVAPPTSTFPAIAAQQAWLPQYPVLIRGRSARADQAVWVVDPTTILDAQPCLTWQDGDVISPEFAEQILLSPGFADETLIAPTFGSEGIC